LDRGSDYSQDRHIWWQHGGNALAAKQTTSDAPDTSKQIAGNGCVWVRLRRAIF
jgi:hypothetical protein